MNFINYIDPKLLKDSFNKKLKDSYTLGVDGITVNKFFGLSVFEVSTTILIISRPAILFKTLGVDDFILVPFPAAKIIIAVSFVDTSYSLLINRAQIIDSFYKYCN